MELNAVIPIAMQTTDQFISYWLKAAYLTLSKEMLIVFGSAIALVLILRAVAQAQQFTTGVLFDTGQWLLKITLIGVLLKSWPLVDEFVVGTWVRGSETLATQLVTSISRSSAKSLQGILQQSLMNSFGLANDLLKSGTFTHPTPWLAALLVLLFSFAASAFTAFEIIVSKLSMALLIALMPLFLVFKCFKATEGLFDQWLGQLTGNALVIVFVSISGVMGMMLLNYAIPHQEAILTFESAMSVVLMSSISLGLIMASVNMARHIGHAVSTTSSAAQLGQHMGMAARLGKIPFNGISRAHRMIKRG